jgi:hypothetical protein
MVRDGDFAAGSVRAGLCFPLYLPVADEVVQALVLGAGLRTLRFCLGRENRGKCEEESWNKDKESEGVSSSASVLQAKRVIQLS